VRRRPSIAALLGGERPASRPEGQKLLEATMASEMLRKAGGRYLQH
jgi:hypothetical protein